MKCRAFITLLGGAAAWPLAARAQQGERMRRIGVLVNNVETDPELQGQVAVFRQALEQLGWLEGRNTSTAVDGSVIKTCVKTSSRLPMKRRSRGSLLVSLVAVLTLAGNAMAQMPAAIATPEEAIVVTLHAEGAQIYECKAGSDRKLAWILREPIATLLLDGKTVGRHYAGPNWEHMDGSAVTAKVLAHVPGKRPDDISWLKLRATAHRGRGTLSGVTTVQQINTQGGVYTGPCDKIGTFHSAPYAADYVFLQKGG